MTKELPEIVHSNAVATCSCSWLAAKLLTAGGKADDKTLFILDCRPPHHFAEANIFGSSNVQLANIIYKRLLKGNLATVGTILPSSSRRAFQTYGLTADVVVVGDADESDDESVANLIVARLNEQRYSSTILQGGLSSFQTAFPHYCSSLKRSGLTVSRQNNSLSRPNQLSGLLSFESLSISHKSSTKTTADGAQTWDSSCPCSSSLHAHLTTLCPPKQLTQLSSSVPDLSSPQTKLSNSLSPNRKRMLKISDKKFPLEIVPFLFLGDSKTAADRKTLDKHNIRYVLNVTSDLPNTFEGDSDFCYFNIAIDDHWSQNLACHFPGAIAFIDEAREKNVGALVHCLAGISRSVTVVVAYLMKTLGKTLDEAYDMVRDHKPNISPNFNFMGQLLDFERQLKLGVELDGQTATSDDEDKIEKCHFLSPTTAAAVLKTGLVRSES